MEEIQAYCEGRQTLAFNSHMGPTTTICNEDKPLNLLDKPTAILGTMMY